VIVAQGGRYCGYTLYVQNGHLVYEANTFGREHGRIVAADPRPKGPVEIAFEYAPDADNANGPAIFASPVGSGTGKLTVNGKQEGSIHFVKYGGFRSAILETFDLDRDTGSPVSTAYQSPFRFARTRPSYCQTNCKMRASRAVPAARILCISDVDCLKEACCDTGPTGIAARATS
jgi:hypothetical protein